MDEKRFEGLKESIRQAGAILRGESDPSRVFVHPDVPKTKRNPDFKFGICIDDEDPELLRPLKIYQVKVLNDRSVKVVDENGDSAIYPIQSFILLDLDNELEEILKNLEYQYAKAS
jgi:hypothetical protein